MKKILLMILLLILSSACAAKNINVITVKLDDKLNEIIFTDTIDILNKYIKPDVSNLIIYSKENKFLNMLEQHLRIAGYAVLVTPKEINTKENDYIFGYILDTVDKKKVNNLDGVIKVEKEVTDDKEYRNSSIYKKLNKETSKTYQKV